jgi:hypothetical protein
MRHWLPKMVPLAVVAVLAMTAGLIPAQPPLPAPAQAGQAGPGDAGNGVEVLARGPVHEGYADTFAESAPTPLVTKMPPDAIDELPPDHKPDGNNVQWIPGYWHFDEDRNDFMWISGFWRSVPPSRVWVPGSWRGVQGGWQWVPGFWQEAPAQQQAQVQPAAQQDVQYLPEPPRTIEVGPTAPATTTTSFYVPGSWVWRGDRYAWRPGFWMEYRSGWVWVPAHFRWSPIGYIYVEGYWDYPLATRGVLYAPIGYTAAVYTVPGYVYTPTYVVSDQCMMGAMFVRRGWGCYYFGDYYGPQYVGGGYTAWCGTVGAGGGFVVGFGVGPRWGYDPLWSYYSVAYRESPGWTVGMGNLYVGRFNGTVAPPPVSLTQQTIVINKVTNVSVTNVNNSYTVVNRSITVNNVNVSGLVMVAPTRIVNDMHPEMKIAPLPPQGRQQEMAAARQLRQVASQRMQHENAVVRQGGGIPKNAAAVHSMKLDVPKASIARAQAHESSRDATKVPPPSPHTTAAAAHATTPAGHPNTATPGAHPNTATAPGAAGPRVEPKVDHTTVPMVPGKGPTTPVFDPKNPNTVPPKNPNTVPPKNPNPAPPPKTPPMHDPKNDKQQHDPGKGP